MVKQSFKLFFPVFLVFAVFLMSGCAVLSPVGNTISSAYENTTTYFNVYYNASRLFQDAEEGIKADALMQRGKEPQKNQKPTIPADATQKLNKVIDKCSNILAFHAQSTFVDDALFLIGKSFYYEGEYVKAERKFTELTSQYPSSDLFLDAQLWYARTLSRQNKLDDAITSAEDLMIKATEKNGIRILQDTYFLLGELFNQQNQYSKALDYYQKALDIADNDELRIRALMHIGDMNISLGEYPKAVESYLRIPKMTSDLYILFMCRLNSAIAYRKMNKYEESLALLSVMIEDFRMKSYLGTIYYERANTLNAMNHIQEAIKTFRLVDTVYAKTLSAYKSSFELGKICEVRVFDYQSALFFYSEASGISDEAIADTSKRKVKAITRYLDAVHRLHIADSLLTARMDTSVKRIIDTSQSARSDSLRGVEISKANPSLPSVDSLRILKLNAYQDVADVFYYELEVPDSARYYYKLILQLSKDSTQIPRIFFVLGELARNNSGKDSNSSKYFREIVAKYPESPYARPARKFLGMEVPVQLEDPAIGLFMQAEQRIDSGQFRKALSILESIEKQHPLSPVAAKSAFTQAWIYEYCFKNYDSAAIRYKTVENKYPKSSYASIMHKRIFEEAPTKTQEKDSTKILPMDRQPMKPSVTDSMKSILSREHKSVADSSAKDTTKTLVPNRNQLEQKNRDEDEIKKEKKNKPPGQTRKPMEE